MLFFLLPRVLSHISPPPAKKKYKKSKYYIIVFTCSCEYYIRVQLISFTSSVNASANLTCYIAKKNKVHQRAEKYWNPIQKHSLTVTVLFSLVFMQCMKTYSKSPFYFLGANSFCRIDSGVSRLMVKIGLRQIATSTRKHINSGILTFPVLLYPKIIE